jgi:hypothetical protein
VTTEGSDVLLVERVGVNQDIVVLTLNRPAVGGDHQEADAREPVANHRRDALGIR